MSIMRKGFKNFASNWFLLSSAGAVLLMCVSRDVRTGISTVIRWDVFLALIYIALIVSSFFRFHKFVSISEIKKDQRTVFFTMFLESVAFLNFCNNLNQGTIKKYIESLSLSSDIICVVCCLFIAIIGFYSVYIFSKWFLLKIKFLLKIISYRKMECLFILAVYLIAIIAIVRANYYYEDDLARAVEGYQLTGSFSRYIATFVSTIVHGDTWLSDISPLPQIIAAVIMSVSGIIMLHIISKDKNSCFFEVVVLIPFGMSPYFLACLSYRYDAPYMALSVFFSIIPLIYKDKPSYKYTIAVFVGTLLMCTTYQASSGIFPMTVILLAFLMWNNGTNLNTIFKFALSSLIGYLLGLIIFRTLLVSPAINEGNYVNSSISFMQIPRNIIKYFEAIYSDLGIIRSLCIISICIGFITFAVNDSKHNKIVSLVLSTICVTLSAVLSFGTYMFFSSPLFATRAMYGFGIFISVFSVVIIESKRLYWGKFSVFILSWFFIVFAFAYGNALCSQKEYTNFRIEQIVSDLKNVDFLNMEQKTIIQISGTTGYAKNVQNMAEHYPILSRGVPVPLREGSFWGAYQLLNYYGIKNAVWNPQNSNMDFNNLDLPVVADNIYHTIKAKDHYILIILK